MGYHLKSEEARALNREIFETIYYASMTASKDLAKVDGPYETLKVLQYLKVNSNSIYGDVTPTDRWEWDVLKDEVKEHGV